MDGDGDGVGDACDPALSDMSDGIVREASAFFGKDFAPAESAGTGFEILEDSAVTLGPVGDVDASLQIRFADSDRQGYSVEVGFTIDEYASAGVISRFAVDTISTNGSSLSCFFVDDDPGMPGVPGFLMNASGGTAPVLPALVLPTAVKHRLVLQAHEAEGARCRLGLSSAVVLSGADGDVTMTISVQRMRLRVDHVVIYDTTRP